MGGKRLQPPSKRRPPWVLAVVGFLMPVLAGCVSSHGRAVIDVDHQTALLDTPLVITVSGLAAHQHVTVRARTADSSDRLWESEASFETDARGALDLRRVAPEAGSYSRADGMGLLWSMHSGADNGSPAQFVPAATGYTVTLTVGSQGSTAASRTLVRLATLPGVAIHQERPTDVGFYGDYFSPVDTRVRRAGLLLLGGSGGGLSRDVEAGLLASHGYPTLDLAYFAEPGLPSALSNIPLEYFARALAWLSTQPGVDPTHLIVDGVSRGSEAALLVGVHYSSLVKAVIALVPSNVAVCAYPGCGGPAWTLDGRPIPYTSMYDDPHPTDQPLAVIPVERISGPILLNCGGQDAVWVSCDFATAIADRLNVAHYPYPHQLLRYAESGHGIGFPVPFVPDYAPVLGGRLAAEAADREDQWPRMLAFLGQVGQ